MREHLGQFLFLILPAWHELLPRKESNMQICKLTPNRWRRAAESGFIAERAAREMSLSSHHVHRVAAADGNRRRERRPEQINIKETRL
jgi:hypothetical protein